ncbi:MAG: FAD-binding oxidoreductase [Clostridia bacterium]|nr:FAD-binding oxidoreductase [Clostridia bacterium]
MDRVFNTVLIISSISATLALLLSIANKTIANYGNKKITINDDKEYIVDGGDSLLSSLIENEIFIPSACGGKGSCGYCKVKVDSGGGQTLPTELGYLTNEDREEGVRLSCQLKVKEDLSISIPEELFNLKQYEYTVNFIKDVTSKIKYLSLNLPEGKEIEFKPGQYIQILVPQYKENDEEIYRAYSIASSPASKNYIELFIGYTGGICTTYIHKYLNAKDKVSIIGPFGDFYYRDGSSEMIMVAIGTGLAPILSILRYMKEHKIDRKATFYFGARTRDDLYALEEINELERALPNFTFVPTLSRPTEKCDWTGDVGRVTNCLEKYLNNIEDKEAYLCGSPRMIDSVVDMLKERGMGEEQIYYDKFE